MENTNDEGFITRTIKIPSSIMDDVKIENVNSNRGRQKKDRQNTEQEIVDLIAVGIETRKQQRAKPTKKP